MSLKISAPEQPRKHLLVVNGEPHIRAALQRQFECDYDVFIAGSADEGYRVMMETRIQVIIADQQMPGMTGVELLTKVKRGFPDTVRVLLTENDDTQAVISAVNDAAIFHCITKPWTTEEIQSVVDEAFKWHTLLNEQQRLSVETQAVNAQMEERITQFGSDLSQANARNQALNVQLRSVIDGIPDCIYVKDAEGRFTLNNRAHLALLGVSTPEEAIGKSDGDFFPVDVAARTYADDQAVMRSGQPLLNWQEMIINPGTDEQIWHHITKVPVLDVQGKVTGLVCMSSNITQQKQDQLAQAQLAAIVENSEDAIIGKDLNGVITSWNKGAKRIYGYTMEEAIGQPISILAPTQLDEISTILARIKRGEYIELYETKRVRKGGAEVDVSLSVSPIAEANGRVVGASTIAHDISGRKHAELALHEQKDLYERLLQTLGDLGERLTIIDSERLVFANDAFCRMTGYSPEELYALPSFMSLIPADERDALAARNRQLAADNTVDGHYEVIVVRKDGQRLYLEAVSKNLMSGDHTQRIVVSRDISDRKRAEAEVQRLSTEMETRIIERTAQLEAANKELEAFSYSVSHDLRSPLRAIDGFSRILVRDYASVLPPDGQRRLQAVRDNAQQMGHLIDDLLAFSRLSRQPLKKQRVAPAQIVQNVLRDLADDLENRQIEFSIGDMPDCDADPALLKQVYANLLSNAIKFTRHCETAHIEVSCLQSGAQPVYCVKDNGAGFDMQYVDKLFGVFQRLHQSDEFEGTGVGLATVQRIIHRHGGRIWAEGEVNKGATISFTLQGETPNG